MNPEENVKIVELARDSAYRQELKSSYLTHDYYDFSIVHRSDGWKIELLLKPLGKTVEKQYKGRLFEDHVNEPRVFTAVLGNRQVGWIESGYEKWNNRMRVWELLVEKEHRKKGIGTLLMKQGVTMAKERKARMLVLETQSCDVPAIDFYKKFGFELIGFDVAAYSNEDIEKKEVRFEFGLKL